MTTELQNTSQNNSYRRFLIKHPGSGSQKTEIHRGSKLETKDHTLMESLQPTAGGIVDSQTGTVIQADQINFFDSLSFQVHQETGQLMVVIKDVKTNEVVKTVPPEELLDTLGKIKESVGALVDKTG